MSRIFCIGRNYADHAKELDNPLSSDLVVFMKPITSLIKSETVPMPKHGQVLHQEAEIVVEIGEAGKNIDKESADAYISSLALGLDLTLRDVQSTLKAKSLPWEKAKAFDASATISELTPYHSNMNLENIDIECFVNGEMRQKGNSKEMIFPIKEIISQLSLIWQLQKGDLIYTGTPAGVSQIQVGDEISVTSHVLGRATWKLIK